MRTAYEQYKKQHLDPRPGEWPRLEYEARQTGRTHRMMEAAAKASAEGFTVDIVVMTHEYGRDLAKRWRTSEWSTAPHFWSASADLPFDMWDREKIEKAHPHRRVFVSHEAIEHHPHYSKLLVELHRFDGKLPWEPK